MSFRVKNCLTFLGGAIVILAMASYLAWHNLSWVVQNRAFQYVYDQIGSGLNNFVPVTMHSSFGPFPLSSAEKKYLAEGAVTVLTSREAVALAAKRGLYKPLGVTIIANTPGDFAGLSAKGRQRLLLNTTRAAIKLKARIMIDCSSADLARLSKEGQISLSLMKKHQIIRAVIFDGGHHLPSLALNPDLIIAPVFSLSTGKTVITHGYVKDALPLSEVLNLSKKLGLTTTITTVPRWPTIAKTKIAMAKLVDCQLLNCG
ncbi:MAG: hypothetical protein M0Z31_04710 [Clostridia bacterium]|nr:hypothetical protein [Clostridia bacterium]